MTVETEITRVRYAGNGSTTVFPFGFQIFAASEIKVTKANAAGVETTLALDVGYTVAGVGDEDGGSVTLLGAPLPSGSAVAIRRIQPIQQGTNLTNQGDYHPEVVERQLDRLAMIDQQQQEQIDRSLQYPVTEAGGVQRYLPSINDRRDRFLVGDDTNAAPIVASDITLSQVRNLLLNGLPSSREGWLKVYGVTADGTADDTEGVQAYVTSRQATTAGEVFIPAGATLRLTDTVTSIGTAALWIGEGDDNGTIGRGSKVLVDTGDKTGLRFLGARNSGMRDICVTGPLDTRRLTGGALIEVGTGSFQFRIQSCTLQRGHRAVWAYGGLSCLLHATRVRLFSGDWALGSTPYTDGDGSPSNPYGDGRAWQGLNLSGGSDVSGSDSSQLFRVGDVPLTPLFMGAFLSQAGLSRLRVTRRPKATLAEIVLEAGTHYTMALAANGVWITPLPAAGLVTGDYVHIVDTGGLFGVGCTLMYFNGGSASNKLSDFSGGFGGDFIAIDNVTPVRGAGAFYLVNGGGENCNGYFVRNRNGSEIKLTNTYGAGNEGAILNERDPDSIPNITDVYETPGGNNTVSIEWPGHGLDGAVDANGEQVSIVIRDMRGVRINGRWLTYRVVDDDNIELLTHRNGSPSTWKENPTDPDPVWVPGTGRASTRVVGSGNFVAANSIFRVGARSAIIIDTTFCRLIGVRTTNGGSRDKTLFAPQITALANNGQGIVRATLKYPGRVQDGNLVRLQSAKKGGVEQHRFDYKTAILVDPTHVDLPDIPWTGAYDAMSDAAPAFLVVGGANLDLGPNAEDFASDDTCTFGDIDNAVDRSAFGVRCRSDDPAITVSGDARGNRRGSTRIEASHRRQRWNLRKDDAETAPLTISANTVLAPVHFGERVVCTVPLTITLPQAVTCFGETPIVNASDGVVKITPPGDNAIYGYGPGDSLSLQPGDRCRLSAEGDTSYVIGAGA